MTVAQLDRAHDFTGHTVAITGGTGVLGGEMACALACLGRQRRDARPEPGAGPALLELMGPDASRAAVHRPTCSSATAWRARWTPSCERFGRVDAPHQRAPGGNKPEGDHRARTQSFFDLPADALRWVFDLNLLGTILPSQVFGRLMAAAKATASSSTSRR